MRLIDADKLLEETRKDRDYAEKNGFLDMYYERQALIDRIKSQPTAYDVDKVVEELEDLEIHFDNDYFSSNREAMIVKNDAIEIVKQGDVSGASEDICEWELKNACYTTSIKHYYSLPTSIVKTFNNCPYCGKKIKVVE